MDFEIDMDGRSRGASKPRFLFCVKDFDVVLISVEIEAGIIVGWVSGRGQQAFG